jgi:hypothetical protein
MTKQITQLLFQLLNHILLWKLAYIYRIIIDCRKFELAGRGLLQATKKELNPNLRN